MCLGLRWLRGNDNDSIGREDDRRGVLGPGAIPATLGRPFSRRSQRPRLVQQLPATKRVSQQLLPIAAETGVIKCCRADVVTHLGHARRP